MLKLKFSLKIIASLAIHPEGLSYKKLSELTKYHINTVSRYITELHSNSIIEIRQYKSNSLRGRKWVNIVRLKKELLESKNITDFFSKIINHNQLSDVLID